MHPVINILMIQILFILKFLGELVLLFLLSALISYIFNIDKASRE